MAVPVEDVAPAEPEAPPVAERPAAELSDEELAAEIIARVEREQAEPAVGRPTAPEATEAPAPGDAVRTGERVQVEEGTGEVVHTRDNAVRIAVEPGAGCRSGSRAVG